MSDINLQLPEDDCIIDAGPGRFADTRALDALQRYFRGKVSLEMAAKELVSMLPSTADKSRGREINQFSLFLCLISRQIPHKHTAQIRLSELVHQVSLSPKLMNGQGQEDIFEFCESMDNFQMHLREWFSPRTGPDPEDADACFHDLNFAAFLARLSQCGFVKTPSYAIWTMRDCLEESINDQESLGPSIGMAAVWVIYAGQNLYTHVVEIPDTERGNVSYQPGKLYHGHALGLERWKFWREALRSVSQKLSSDEYQRMAYNAAELMEAIEESRRA
ncbi:hypothetical protein GQ53DRAFT_835395 [Thozetella sp. PMI_491]|nr:hypothetical protein GQ53DRAFT_835395 [Thozetella sp. PMI_491]